MVTNPMATNTNNDLPRRLADCYVARPLTTMPTRHRPTAWLLALLPLLASCAQARLSLINWNTYHLFDHQQHLPPAAAWLAEQAPAIVALQEVLHCDHEKLRELASTWGHDHAVMHKESGYPVALTSNEPIEVVECRTKGFHHGYLHARTHGFDVLVVHFWPGKVHEPEHVAALAQQLRDQGRPVLIVGDFNSEIRHDEDYLQQHGHLGNVVAGQRRFDYRITDCFLDLGFVDVTHQHAPDAHYTFGSPALIPKWRKNMTEVHTARRRIDFVFADARTAARSLSANVLSNDDTVGTWSDHYPLRVVLTAHHANERARQREGTPTRRLSSPLRARPCETPTRPHTSPGCASAGSPGSRRRPPA